MNANADDILATSDRSLVDMAYRKLKQDSYYDTVDLFLRARIAQFEASVHFEDEMQQLASVVTELRAGEAIIQMHRLATWLGCIRFRSMPKSIQDVGNHEVCPLFISNDRSSASYTLAEVNYFIDAPVALHILDVLWCWIAGPALEVNLDPGCLGNRLESGIGSNQEGSSSRLFHIFHRQYAKWRDEAISLGQSLLDNNIDVLICALDLKQCFYRLSVYFEDLKRTLQARIQSDTRLKLALALTDILAEVHRHYRTATARYISVSHSPEVASHAGLPVGLASSRMLANWVLARFDASVRKSLTPAYYGRYVDDMLIVIAAPNSDVLRRGSEAVVRHYFEDTGLIEKVGGELSDSYRLSCIPSMLLQKEKMILHFFDHRHSRAGLAQFGKEIAKQASEFRFLPQADEAQDLDECAYDVLYRGSVNKLRSVIGLSENSMELSKYLSRRLIQYRLCSDSMGKDITEQVFRFYRGRNMFDFCRLWEKVFTLLQASGQYADCARFYMEARSTVERLTHNDAELASRVREDTEFYLTLAVAMPSGLLAESFLQQPPSKRYASVLNRECKGLSAWETGRRFRHANMVRHEFVAYPLLNYTSYAGSLTQFEMSAVNGVEDWSIDKSRKYSPRFIHQDEYQLFLYLRGLVSGRCDAGDVWSEVRKTYLDHDGASLLPNAVRDASKKGLVAIRVLAGGRESQRCPEQLCIGVANLRVLPENIEGSFHPHKKPNTAFARQAELFELINCAGRKPKCDILVLPEVSVPYAWLPFMVAQARKHQVGMVFGLEHWVADGQAFNLAVTVLPFRDGDKYKACLVSLRVKNHYSPQEKTDLGRLGLSVPPGEPAIYELYEWRGVRFSVYNCFELTDVHHRGLFRSELDFMIVVAWNRDTHYYSNMIESAARDLHCYVVQANTSQYGDSRITAPKASAEMDCVRVKGGSNAVLLKAMIDIEELRDFQCKQFCPSDERFKPLPAGFDHSRVRRRGMT